MTKYVDEGPQKETSHFGSKTGKEDAINMRRDVKFFLKKRGERERAI